MTCRSSMRARAMDTRFFQGLFQGVPDASSVMQTCSVIAVFLSFTFFAEICVQDYTDLLLSLWAEKLKKIVLYTC